MASHTADFDVVRVQYESKVPIKIALQRLDTEVKAFYQNKPGGHPKHFDDLIDLIYPTDNWKAMNEEIQPAIGPSGFVLDHNHHSHEYRALYQPNEPYLETHLYSLAPPIGDYSVVYADLSNAIILPHRILVLERLDGSASVHYDLPSSQINTEKEEVRTAAERMDKRLQDLFERVLKED